MTFATNLVTFGRLLKRAGLDVTPESTRLFARSLEQTGVDSRAVARAAGRAIFVRRKDQRETFDRAFDLFWRRYGPLGSDAPVLPRMRQERHAPPAFPAAAPPGDAAIDAPASVERTLASAREHLRHADFASLTPAEASDALAMLAALRPRLPMRRSRRWIVERRRGLKPARSRMLRASLRTLGEPVHWRWLVHPRKPRPIALICDISGSMERYSRLMLRFAHALSRSGAAVEVFVFGTRLTRITRQLAVRDADAALARVGRSVVDWSGGTRIGESLRELNQRWVRRTIRSGAIVLIVSDGWERGDPDLLAAEMARLRRSCYRLYWLDPLASQPGFEPAVQGLVAALPHIDELVACASVASLETLAGRLDLERRRP